MGNINNTNRQYIQTCSETVIVVYIHFNPGLLQLYFTILTVTGHGMFKLQFGKETYTVVKFMAEVQNKTMKINAIK